MRKILLLILLIAMGIALSACDRGGFKVGSTHIEGHGMAFEIPDGFTDIMEHPDFENSALAMQVRRQKGAAVVGNLGETLYSSVMVLPLGSVEDMEVNEEFCTRVANQARGQLQSRSRSLGLSGRTAVGEVHAPGEIPDTECEFLLVVGGDEYHVLTVIFSLGETRFMAGCEADGKEEAIDLCDDLFYSWRF